MDRNKIRIVRPTVYDLKCFFENNQSKHFRYFEKRSYDVISNHLYTALYLYEDIFFGYGHIDIENKNWLGIFIKEDFRGKKLSKYIMDDLLKNCQEDVYLTVDLENINAFNLYKKVGFNIVEKRNNHYLMIYKK